MLFKYIFDKEKTKKKKRSRKYWLATDQLNTSIILACFI